MHGDSCAIELEAEALSLLDDPVKGFVRESIGRVAATDIAVDTGKPSLLELAASSQTGVPTG